MLFFGTFYSRRMILFFYLTNQNQRLKNFCKQKNIDFVDNSNIIEEHLGSKKVTSQ